MKGKSLVVTTGGSTSPIHWHSTITIVGITLCVIIILASVVFICHHRWLKKQQAKRKEMYATNAATQQALLSNGDIPQSPSISSPGSPSSGPNSGSANIGFSDFANATPSPEKLPMTPEELPSPDVVPTPDAHRPDFYIITQGVLASPSHTPSNVSASSSVTRLKSPSKTASPNHVSYPLNTTLKSPHSRPVKPTSLPYPLASNQPETPPLTSPYAANATPNDYLHEPAMFRKTPPGGNASKPDPHHHHSRPHHHHHHSKDNAHSRHRSGKTRSPHSGEGQAGSQGTPDSRSRSFDRTPTNFSPTGSGHVHSRHSSREEVNKTRSPPRSLTRGSVSSDGSRRRRSRSQGSLERQASSPSHSINHSSVVNDSDNSKGSKKRPLSGASVKDKVPVSPTAMTTITENITPANRNDKTRSSKKKHRTGDGDGRHGDGRRGKESQHSPTHRTVSKHGSGHRDSDRRRRRSDRSHHRRSTDDGKRHSSTTPGKGKSTSKHRPKSSSNTMNVSPILPTRDRGNTETLTPRDVQNANYITPNPTAPTTRSPHHEGYTTNNYRPQIKQLPIRRSDHPDGQSPQEKLFSENNALGSPTSNVSSDMMTPKHVVGGGSRSQTPSEFTMDMDFEYDYYMPNVPGSFLYMEQDYLSWPQNMQRQNSGRHRNSNKQPNKNVVEIPLQQKN